MNEITLIVLSLLIGLISGFIGGIATGGSMIAIPGLMFLGLPPSTAIATSNLGAIFSLSSVLRYHKASLIDYKTILPFLLLTFISGFVGSYLLLHVNQQFMQPFFGAICILLALLFAFTQPRSKNIKSRSHEVSAFVSIFAVGVFASFFGTGGGFFVVYILTMLRGMNMVEANATTKVISIGGLVSTLAVFAGAGIIDYRAGIPMVAGSALGGYLGAHAAIKKGDAKVKTIFLAVALISGLNLIIK